MKKPYRVTIALLLTMVCFIGFNKKIFASEYNVVATTKENKWYKVQESGNYYKVFSRTEGKDRRFHSSALSQTSDEHLSGYTELFLYSTQRLMDHVDLPNIREGEVMDVKLCTMTAEIYRFWDRFETILGANVFNMRPSGDQNALSNMRGALGYWAGYGVHPTKGVRRITVAASSAAAE